MDVFLYTRNTLFLFGCSGTPPEPPKSLYAHWFSGQLSHIRKRCLTTNEANSTNNSLTVLQLNRPQELFELVISMVTNHFNDQN